MYLIGYFPGADFGSDSQYGRQVHVYKFIETVLDMDDVTSTFFVDDHGEQFVHGDVRSIITTGGFPIRLYHELRRSWLLIRMIRRSEEPVVVYTRESPHFAPVVATELTDAKLVVESNGVPKNVRQNVGTDLQYVTLTGVRWVKWRRADHVVAVSDSVAGFLREGHGVDDLTVVENGVDTDLFDCRREVADGPPYTICYVGGLQAWQNIDLMIRTVAAMDTEVEFLVVGGEQDRQAHYGTVAADCGIADRVRFVGRVPHDEVPEYVNGADLCFGPFARERPASPLKMYEYLGCGREVVLVNDTGLEYLDDYPGVHRFEYADAETLAPRVDQVVSNVGTNQAGTERIRRDRSWRAVSEQVVSVCRAASQNSH